MSLNFLQLPSRRITAQKYVVYSPRESALTEATKIITNLMRCVLWLLRNNIHVTGFTGYHLNGIDRLTITVVASPKCYIAFGSDNCAWRERRQVGAQTIYTWWGERFGVRVEWREVSACA